MGVRRSDASDGAAPTVAMRKTPVSDPGTDATLSSDAVVPASPPGPRAFARDWSERGRYALVSELARGGGGRIAVAVDRKLGRKVALKRPLDRDGEERLEREALVLARLEHPAIVPIHDAGHDVEGNPYYTMKLLGGATLADRLSQASTFDRRLALLAAVITVADAVAYAHSQHVIHRDLKPGNVLVGEFGEVALIDWGLGKILGDATAEVTSQSGELISAELTGHGAVIGTPAYMAPEQALGEEVDERADVYALGAMLYHVLSGDVPYGRASTEETLVKLVEGPPPPIEEREPRVPPDLAAIVATAMARKAADRYRTANELALDLHRYQTGKLVAAHRYKLRTRAWRWARRHVAAIAASVAAVALGVAGVAIARSGGTRPDETCAGLDAPVRAVWNAGARAAVDRAFAASQLPFAGTTFRAVAAALDQRADRIASMRVEACRATRVIGAQTADAMDLRMQCLDRRTAELGTIAGVLGKADAGTVTHALDALGGLGRVEDCADVARLRDLVPLPDDPARRAEIQRVDDELVRVAALDAAGKYDRVIGLAAPLATRALATGYGPVHARALLRWADLLIEREHEDTARRLLELAGAVADRSRDDVVRGRALVGLVRIAVDHSEDHAAAAALIAQAAAVVDRTHDAGLEARLLGYESHLASDTSQFDDGIALARRAVERAQAGAPGELDRARFALGSALAYARHYDEATRELQGLIDTLTARYGTSEHPDISRCYQALSEIAYHTNQPDRAIELEKQAIATTSRFLPPYSLDALTDRKTMAQLEDEVGHYAEAEADYRAVIADAEAHLGQNHSLVVALILNHGNVLGRLNRFDDAIAAYRDGVARAQAAGLRGDVAEGHSSIGGIYVQLEQPKKAIPELEAALEVETELTGADGWDAAYTRADLGRSYYDAGDAARSVTELRRALIVLDAQAGVVDRGMYHTALAMSLWKVGDKDAARAEARASHALLDHSGVKGDDALHYLVEWERHPDVAPP
jgi:tetratricopeptide (TPR) repeat protein